MTTGLLAFLPEFSLGSQKPGHLGGRHGSPNAGILLPTRPQVKEDIAEVGGYASELARGPDSQKSSKIVCQSRSLGTVNC